MENASKALIIAGAILISIVIISLGVVIVNNVTGIINGAANMSAQEVATFNAKFESYEGTRVSGANARALYDILKSHNNQNREDASMQVDLSVGKPRPNEYEEPASEDVLSKDYPEKSKILAGKSYTVQFAKDAGSDRIVHCYINPVSGSISSGGQQQGGGDGE